MFNPEGIEKSMAKHPAILPMKSIFQPLRGNTKWAEYSFEKALQPNVGPGEFFDLDQGTVNKWALRRYACPAITSIRYEVLQFSKERLERNCAKRRKSLLLHVPPS